MKLQSVFIAMILSMALWAAEDTAVVPSWELKLNEGEFNKIANTGSVPSKVNVKNASLLKWGEGRFEENKALYFCNPVKSDKRNIYGTLILASSKNVDFSKPFTLMLWIKLDKSLRKDKQYSIVGNTAGDLSPGFRLYYGWQAFKLRYGKKTVTINRTKFPVGFDSWTHLAVVYDTKEIKLYYNGILAAAVEGVIEHNKNELSIGSFLKGYAYGFNGAICDIKVYNSALSAEKILNITQDSEE